jgi:hypothetical protein
LASTGHPRVSAYRQLLASPISGFPWGATQGGVAGESDEMSDDWTLPPPDQKLSRKELQRRHRELIDLARRITRREANPKGGFEAVLAAAQYLGEELTRRSQNRQTGWIIAMTAAITFMTLVIMVATVAPEWVQAVARCVLVWWRGQ